MIRTFVFKNFLKIFFGDTWYQRELTLLKKGEASSDEGGAKSGRTGM